MATDFLEDLRRRNLIHQISAPELAAALKGGRVTGYIGFDPTADSLHVGSLLPLVTLRRFQQAGHRPIGLVGGGTGLVGDPSGRESERSLLTLEQLEQNLAFAARWSASSISTRATPCSSTTPTGCAS
jgi:tyrosyl-tRNA synthetase